MHTTWSVPSQSALFETNKQQQQQKISSKKLKIDFCMETSAFLHLMKENWDVSFSQLKFPCSEGIILKNLNFHCQICSFCIVFFSWMCRQSDFGKELKNQKAHSGVETAEHPEPSHERRLGFLISYIHDFHHNNISECFLIHKIFLVGFWMHQSTFYQLYSLYNCKFPLQCPAWVTLSVESWWFVFKSIKTKGKKKGKSTWNVLSEVTNTGSMRTFVIVQSQSWNGFNSKTLPSPLCPGTDPVEGSQLWEVWEFLAAASVPRQSWEVSPAINLSSTQTWRLLLLLKHRIPCKIPDLGWKGP